MSQDKKEFYAHREYDKSNKAWLSQPLEDHLINAALLAGAIGKKIGCYYICLLLGLLHDIGKACERFQRLLLKLYKGLVNHSSAGAIFLHQLTCKYSQEILRQKFIKDTRYIELLCFPLLAHHGLFDVTGPGQNLPGNAVSKVEDRMSFSRFNPEADFQNEIKPFVLNFLEPKLIAETGLNLKELYFLALQELDTCIQKVHAIGPRKIKKAHKQNLKEQKLYEGYLTRLFLSILKTADCLDSSQWYVQDPVDVLTDEQTQELFSKFYQLTEAKAEHFASLQDESPLNKPRVQLSELAQQYAVKQKSGIYQLDMPTGSGKTATSLRYAVTNNHTFDKSRIFYVAPFLSIVEQSAEDIKKVLGKKWVLEHHSNVVDDQDNLSNQANQEDPAREVEGEFVADQTLYRPKAYIQDYWDSPVVVTTLVQFYNTLFGGRASNICRFCKLLDSTIIIDEIQSLPVKHIYPFNSMLNFLAQFMGANIVLCTATQPPLDSDTLDYPLYLAENAQIIPPAMLKVEEGGKIPEYLPKTEEAQVIPGCLTQAEETQIIPEALPQTKSAIDLSVFKRAKVYPLWSTPGQEAMTGDELVDCMDEELEHADSLLCILNTKDAVKLLYDKFTECFPEAEVFYLSTNLCAAHRLDRIEEIRSQLKQNRKKPQSAKKVICVTTSLIEAGVNVDFDLVGRSITGSDSIQQAEGRCNREGLLLIGGKVFIFRLKEDVTDNRGLQDIYKRGEITKGLIDDVWAEAGEEFELDLDDLTKRFYSKYFINNTKCMNLPISTTKLDSSGINLLSTNDANLLALKNMEQFQKGHKLWQAFATAARYMQLIDQDTQSVIVPYENSELLRDLLHSIDQQDFTRTKKLLRKLQRYSVNVPRWQKLEEFCVFSTGESDKALASLGIHILREEHYDTVCGLQLDSSNRVAFII